MTNDDRKKLEDRIIAYGDSTRDGIKKMERAWSSVMDAITDIERKEEKDDTRRDSGGSSRKYK